GIGMKKEDQARIFERYFQVSASYGLNTGSGIGLHMVKNYVDLLEGTIKVNSEPDKGSEFKVDIPVKLQHNSHENASRHPNKGKKHSVLIAEDHEEFRKFLYEELIDEFEVYTAINGVEALEIAKEFQPDLVISDVMMPGMSGIE